MSMKSYCGVIYIMTNPSFQNYVKIGYATNLEQRLNQLNRSETIPYAFRAYATYDVEQKLTDKVLHDLIDRLNPDLRSIEQFDGKKRTKEFYAMSAEDAYSLLESIALISGTLDRLKMVKPEGHEIADEEMANEIESESKRGPVLMTKIGIPVGAELKFIDDKNIVATVVDDRHVEYNGETTSLSALARQLKKYNHPVQGTLWFTYNGKKISDIRDGYDAKNVSNIG